MILSQIHFPSIKNIVEWPNIFGDGWYGFNKIALIAFIAAAVPALIFFIAGRQSRLVPRGVQGFVEGIPAVAEDVRPLDDVFNRREVYL